MPPINYPRITSNMSTERTPPWIYHPVGHQFSSPKTVQHQPIKNSGAPKTIQHQPIKNSLQYNPVSTTPDWPSISHSEILYLQFLYPLPAPGYQDFLNKVIFLDKVSFKKYRRYGALIGGSGKMRSKSIHFYLVLTSQTICAAYRPPGPESAIFA